MKRFLLFSLLLVVVMPLFAQNAEEANPDLNLDAQYFPPKETDVQQRLDQWQDLKFGVIIHWGLYAVPGIVESWSICSEDEDWIPRDSTMEYNEYKRWYWNLSKTFCPNDFNPDQWAQVAQNAGAKYVVFTTKHHDGFAMYDTKYSDFKITNGPFASHPKSDVARYVFDAFRSHNMMIGAYYSKPDWHSQDYWWSRYATPNRHVNYKIENHPYRWNNFCRFVYNQIDEITANYGPIDILWLDGGWVRAPQEDIHIDDIAAMARRNQPGLIMVDRTVAGPYENYRTPEKMIPEKQLPYPWETCMPLSKDWGFVPDATFKSAEEILNTLVEVVAKGGSLLLGIGPTPEGVIEPRVVDRLNEIGQWLNRNGEAIYNTRAVQHYSDGNVWFTGSKDGNFIYAIATKVTGSTLVWHDNNLRKGSQIVSLATGKPVKYSVKNSVVTVQLPKEIEKGMPVALKIIND